MALLDILDLHVSIEGKSILNGINLSIADGEVHAVMGPNGAGKSTLSSVIVGKQGFTINSGTIIYDGVNLLTLESEKRSCLGIFLAFQYPVEIPGVSTVTFLKTALNAQRQSRGLNEVDAMQFLKLVREKISLLGIGDDMLRRPLNVGFSGGEKKRIEILQMSILEPRLAVLDEIDSGLDIDALKVLANSVNSMRSSKRAFLIITHYQRLLDYIIPDHVHVISNGRVVRSGGRELALELENIGYTPFSTDIVCG